MAASIRYSIRKTILFLAGISKITTVTEEKLKRDKAVGRRGGQAGHEQKVTQDIDDN